MKETTERAPQGGRSAWPFMARATHCKHHTATVIEESAEIKPEHWTEIAPRRQEQGRAAIAQAINTFLASRTN